MKFAVIPTAGERECLADCLAAIGPQVDRVFVIDNSVDKRIRRASSLIRRQDPGSTHVIHDPSKPPNLSRLWNLGLDAAFLCAGEEHHVAVLNDDAIVPYDWFETVTNQMAATGAVAGCSGPVSVMHTRPGPVPLETRMTGWAFILDGRAELRADERLQWWYGDDMLDWTARKRGGMVMTGIVPAAQNLFPNGSMTPELHAQAARDAQTFRDIWGMTPW